MTLLEKVLPALRAFVNSRPGFDWRNYGDAASYRSDMRRAMHQREDALTMIDKLERYTLLSRAHPENALRITDDDIRQALSHRLTISAETADSVTLDYCTGQYYPTEYRAAAASVAASLLWVMWRNEYEAEHATYEGAADAIRQAARIAFRSRSVRKYFN